jgi:hypothetical protein
MTKREDRARALLLDVLSANGSDRKLAAIRAFADEVRAETLREAERDAGAWRAVREALLRFAHPAYGVVGTLRGMAAILRKPAHGFDSTPALLDAVADVAELNEAGRLTPAEKPKETP